MAEDTPYYVGIHIKKGREQSVDCPLTYTRLAAQNPEHGIMSLPFRRVALQFWQRTVSTAPCTHNTAAFTDVFGHESTAGNELDGRPAHLQLCCVAHYISAFSEDISVNNISGE